MKSVNTPCVLCGKPTARQLGVNYDNASGRVVAPDFDGPESGIQPVGSECAKTLPKAWVFERASGWDEDEVSRWCLRRREGIALENLDRLLDDPLLTPAGRLRAFIRARQPGGCRQLSLGEACLCPLCDVDRLVAVGSGS